MVSPLAGASVTVPSAANWVMSLPFGSFQRPTMEGGSGAAGLEGAGAGAGVGAAAGDGLRGGAGGLLGGVKGGGGVLYPKPKNFFMFLCSLLLLHLL